MRQKRYKLSVLPLFEEDLNEIVGCITNKLQNPDAALRLVDDIEIAVNTRLETPLAYVVIDDVMEVRRVMYSKRDIDNLRA